MVAAASTVPWVVSGNHGGQVSSGVPPCPERGGRANTAAGWHDTVGWNPSWQQDKPPPAPPPLEEVPSGRSDRSSAHEEPADEVVTENLIQMLRAAADEIEQEGAIALQIVL